MRHCSLLPDLVAAIGLEAYERSLNRMGGGTASVDLEVHAAALPRPIQRRETVFSDDDVALAAVQPLVEVLRVLGRQRLPVDRIQVVSRVYQDRRTAMLVGASLPQAGRVRRGSSLTLDVRIRPHGRPSQSTTLTLDVPHGFPEGPAELRLIPGRLLTLPVPDSGTPEETMAAFAVRPARHDLVLALIPMRSDTSPVAASHRTDWVLKAEPLIMPALVTDSWP